MKNKDLLKNSHDEEMANFVREHNKKLKIVFCYLFVFRYNELL